MADYGLPVLYALFLWWFSTGLIIYLDSLPRRTFRWSMLGATGFLLAALYGLWAGSADDSVGGAYLAFTCGLVVWGWHEMSFLMGFVTGSRSTACPDGCRGWRHFVHAVEAIVYHELAIAGTAVAVVALTWGADNQVGTWTFMVLWVMRISAKLNVYLGVPNLTEEFLPEHLQYLKSFLTKKPMNVLFPVSVTLATIVAVQVLQAAVAVEASPFDVAALTFIGTLLALAILEHWFLVLPLPDAALWSWILGARAEHSPQEADGTVAATPAFATLAVPPAFPERPSERRAHPHPHPVPAWGRCRPAAALAINGRRP